MDSLSPPPGYGRRCLPRDEMHGHHFANSNLRCESIQLTPISLGDVRAAFEFCANGQHSYGDHEHAIRLTSESIFLSCNRLRAFVARINTWLESGDAGRLSFVGEFPLEDDTANAELSLTFKDRPDIISSDDKPVVTLTYRVGRLAGDFSFVTDQSCLAGFARETNRLLAAIAG